ncbi:FHA domain-containing protein [Plantibacter sp. M259]|uniref:FHA domain-containing protein n=1 Tax=Plantibacter sp. M259 TaxID=2583822 RepID=UPI001110EC75|nr:FHA domain-containing protein [Plantibacter sp. M259]
MRSPDLTDTGLDLDLAGTADDVVALVQRAVAASGEDAQQTRHYVAIDGGTSADIRLRVVSVDDPAPLLAFAITTAPSARGTAAATFIMQHGVQKRRRQRSLLGQEPFLAFLRAVAELATESDPDASATLRVHGTRTVLAPRPAAAPGSAEASPAGAPAYAPVTDGSVVPGWAPATPGAPAPTPSSDVSTPTSAEPAPVFEAPAAQVPAPERAVPETPAPAAPAPAAPAPEPTWAPAGSAPDVTPVVVEPPAAAPQFREPPVAPAQTRAPAASTSSVPPELQITVPPGLIAGAPASPVAPEPNAPAPARPVAEALIPTPEADLGATVVSASLRAGDFALELPDGERIPLRGPILLGRNPAARPEQPDAELRSLVDPRMSVSKTHTVVVPGRRSLRVTDLHSTNGTTITDASGAVTVCQPGEAYVVEAGSTIGIGEFPIRVVVG